MPYQRMRKVKLTIDNKMKQQLTNKDNRCLNCGTALQGNFCAECGQPVSTGQISFEEAIRNFFGITFALEGPLWLTIWLLIVNPGKLFREYIGGKRKTYYKPVAFFILLTAAYLILRAMINFDPLADESVKTDMEELAAISAKSGEVFRMMSANINNILFLLVFSIAIMLKLFFRKRYNLAEYTSMALFIVGIYTLVKIITMFADKFAGFEIDNIEIAILLLLIFYSSFSLFQQKDVWSVIKYALVSIFSLGLYILFGIGFFFLIESLR